MGGEHGVLLNIPGWSMAFPSVLELARLHRIPGGTGIEEIPLFPLAGR
jgi:hypothetical protein